MVREKKKIFFKRSLLTSRPSVLRTSEFIISSPSPSHSPATPKPTSKVDVNGQTAARRPLGALGTHRLEREREREREREKLRENPRVCVCEREREREGGEREGVCVCVCVCEKERERERMCGWVSEIENFIFQGL